MSYNFNQKIDHDFLTSMYEDDYVYVSEIFQTTLAQLIPDVELVKKTFADNEPDALRRQVHKIKPAYGFVGLRDTEAMCQQFENECLSVSLVTALQPGYDQLIDTLEESNSIIAEEIKKLKAYIS